LKNRIQKLINLFIDIFNIGQAVDKNGREQNDFLGLVKQAHREWQIALNNFDYLTDPDMIDFGIYNIEAAEKKYVCLLKTARKENITADLPVDDANLVRNLGTINGSQAEVE